MLEISDLFDENLYLDVNPEIAEAVNNGIVQSGFDHFIRFGQFEGRDPSIFFDTNFYLTNNPDVAALVQQNSITPIQHFIQVGQFENLDPNSQFNTDIYLQTNPGVADAVQQNLLTAIEHFVNFGIAENRLFSQNFIGIIFDVVVTSAANNGNDAAIRFDGLTGRLIGEFPNGGELTDPRDIVQEIDGSSTVLINGGNDNVLRFDATTGNFIETFIEFPELNGGGAVFGPDNNYYVGARSLGSIVRFNGQTGDFIDEFIPSELVDFPRGFVFGSDGNFYLGNGADPATGGGGGTVIQYDGLTGQVLNPNFVNDPELSPLDVINGLDGNIYVSSEFPFGQDDSVASVRVYDVETGALLDVLDAGLDAEGVPILDAPRGLGFGPDGNLYASSTGTGSVVRFDGATGDFIDVFIEFPQLNGQALNFVPAEN
ncbi:MAG: hypothetical protein F6K18_16430 [Okeania sp. SIO2C2]|uniref:Vgb family protein n=1 Tax=Okeania sp. SIO2C2 TaxID=2607787 RepID=UPI0013BC83B3|nr:hypothetical protein [Okeania sp. SIO2C2]NEP88285.1 hypothetical protein [Okeania sp. SIO2C2]